MTAPREVPPAPPTTGRLVGVPVGVLVVLLVGVLAGCAGGSTGGGTGGGASEGPGVPEVTSTAPPEEGGPLTDLPECPPPPEPVDAGDVADLVVPDGTVLTGVEDLGGLVSVRGYAALTPIQVRRFYATSPEVEPFVLEDELYEAEILYGAGESRVFVRAQAQCRQGSVLSVFVGPEDGEGLPPLTGR